MIPPKLSAFASRIGLTGLAIAILLALLAVQTVRLEGFKLWPISVEGWKPKAERLERDIEAVKQAQKIAAEKARAARIAKEQEYRDHAERIDREHEAELESARARTERYIAANRVRNEAIDRAAGGPGAGPDSGGAEGGDGRSEAPVMVAVSDEDIRICTSNTLRLEAVRRWALGLNE